MIFLGTTVRSSRLRAIAALIGFALALASAVHAHNPYESWASGRLRGDTLEIAITMAQSTALRLIDPEMKVGALSPQNFGQHRSRLEAAARDFFIFTTAKKRLVPQKSVAEFTDENDVVFTLTYPKPAPGPLHVHAAFLKKLGEGYGGVTEINDHTGANLGWDQLSFDNPNFEVPIPAPAARTK